LSIPVQRTLDRELAVYAWLLSPLILIVASRLLIRRILAGAAEIMAIAKVVE
jgi:hypothetical protein